MISKVLNISTARAVSSEVPGAGRFLKRTMNTVLFALVLVAAFYGAPQAQPFAGGVENIDSAEIAVLIDEKPFSADLAVHKNAAGARIFNSNDITLFSAPGRLETVRSAGKNLLINHITVADYIAGTVFSEAGSYEPEFLSALAVLVRTMVYREILTRSGGASGRHPADAPYILCARTHCASFRGMPSGVYSNRVRLAVGRTRNRILKYRGAAVDVYFSANCGGFRHTPSELYGGGAKDADYFSSSRGPACPCSVLKQRKWEAVLPAAELKRIFGFRVVSLEKTDRAAVVVNNKIRLDFDRFMQMIERSKLGRVKSPGFVIRYDEKNDRYILNGAGVGHGIGLCDDGAAALAASGRNCLEILRFYYKGCDVYPPCLTPGSN